MLTETAQDLMFTPDAPQMLVAVFPHPLHGRLIERPMMMVTHRIELMGEVYELTWRADGVAYYEPAGLCKPKVVPKRQMNLDYLPTEDYYDIRDDD
jgi:hypothetical protein